MDVIEVAPHLDPPDGALRIGLVVPHDLVIDDEYWRLAPDGVVLHLTRTAHLEVPVTVEMAEQVSERAMVAQGVRDLSTADPAAVAYACTSGSFIRGVLGEQELRRTMEEAGARRAVTTSGALLEALAVLGIGRVAVATPYDRELTAGLARFLEEAGHPVTSAAYLGLRGGIARVSSQTVLDLALAVDRPTAEAVFFSCTNLRTLEVLVELEQRLERPVLSANQVTMWAALRAAGAATGHLRDQRLFAAAP